MTYFAETLEIATRGRGTHDITREVQRVVGASGTLRGLCTVFVHHTSASLIINENADPNVHVEGVVRMIGCSAYPPGYPNGTFSSRRRP